MILEGKRILVTGGTGSMGKVLVRRVLSGELGTPAKLIVFSRDEAKQHEMRLSYLNRRAATDEVIYNNFRNVLEFVIGDVRNYDDLCAVLREVDVVANAAALKQVPTCEYFPLQAIRTNCLGPSNIVRAIVENGYPVETVVGISTDKACQPVNVMGMTKALQERIFISANILSPETRFICVRYGNVMASRGSVIPLFHEQIRAGGPVTVTLPHMSRFLLTINQAVDTVFAALRHARAGEIFVPIVPSATVIHLARALVGDRDIEIRTIGIRPGEKIHEVLISQEESHRVSRHAAGYYVVAPMLPELRPPGEAPESVLDKEYSSADSILDYEQSLELLREHELMVEDVDLRSGEELLR